MSNIRGLSDIKKETGGGRGGPQGGSPFGMGGGGGGGGGFPGLNLGRGAPSQDSKRIKHLQDGQLKQELANAGSKLVVIDFTASWCGPCQMIKPHFSEFADKYTNAVFVKIDVDEASNTAKECGIKAMPTFQFYKNTKKVDEFSGADPNKLKGTIEKHYSASSDSSSSFGTSGGYVLGSRSPSSTTSTSSNVSVPTQGNVLGTTSPSAPSSAPTADVNEVFLLNLVDMGFDKEKSTKALQATKSASLDAAMDWILSHPDEESGNQLGGTSQPQPPVGPQVTKNEPTPMDAESTQQSQTPEKPPTVHNAVCNNCMEQIIGTRYHSKTRRDYDLCPACHESRDKAQDPDDTWEAYTEDVQIEKRPLTKEEIEEGKRKLQEKIKKIREDREKEERESEIAREKARRVGGKDAQEAKRLHEQRQREREAEIKRKEKEDERLAKEKIKAKLEQDKRDREASRKAAQGLATAGTLQPAPTQATPTSATKTEYTEALIQIRLPDGNSIKATFKPTDPVRTVHNHIGMLLGSQNFSLMTNFPKKIFSPRDSAIDTTTLQQAELVPSGTFVVTKL